MPAKFPFEPWRVAEVGFVPANLRENESLFALGNGFIGMRGNLEEGCPTGAETIEGTFLNGVFDSEPITYGEAGFGYAKNHETICNVMDAKGVALRADGEALDLGTSRIDGHCRALELREGLLRRSFTWTTPSGAVLAVTCQRLVSLTRLQLAAVQVRVQCVSGAVELELGSGIRPAVIAEGDPNDPRNAAGKDRRLEVGRRLAEGGLTAMEQRTKATGFSIVCAVSHRLDAAGVSAAAKNGVTWGAKRNLSAGEEVVLEKAIAYAAARRDEADIWEQTIDLAVRAPDFGVLAAEQRAYLDDFWAGAGMSIQGDDALLQGLRFNLFHLLQAAGRDGRRNIAAKGLTGEGYEGHYFWDTEAYILPVFLHTEPEVAKKLLEYRHAILPAARERARAMGHDKGALFAWRTIDGEECSAYFPAGSAQYHIDGDIAKAVWDYWYVTRDLDFLAACGAEILVETARLWLDVGFYSDAKGGSFVINEVTGPDEYNVMVDNNRYTNRVAAENLRHAAEALALLRAQRPADYDRLCRAVDCDPREAEDWLRAAERMYFADAEDGIYPQDDGFLRRKPWPLDAIPAEKRPLLMHYHPLHIYRHQVSKQADLILEMTLFGEHYTPEEKRRNFAFYDGVTTHDSSLSMAIFSILACEIGEIGTAYDYFMASARLDLDDIHRNTKDGLHMANMAGAWNCIVKGFGGMRYRDDTLSFAPVCPAQWEGYAFSVRFRGRTIEVRVTRDGAEYRLIAGEPIEIYDHGELVTIR